MKFIINDDAVFISLDVGAMKQVGIGHKNDEADIEASGFKIITEREALSLIVNGHQVVLLPGSATVSVDRVTSHVTH